MNNGTQQLLSLISACTQNLMYGSEGDYPLSPFIWEASKQGEFSLARLLKLIGICVPVGLEDFLGWQECLEDFYIVWEEFLQNSDYTTFDRNTTFIPRHEQPMHANIPLVARQAHAEQIRANHQIAVQKRLLMEQRYQTLLEVLQVHTENLQVYRLVKYDDSPQATGVVFESLRIIIGRAKDGNWIGITPICCHDEFPNRPTPERFIDNNIRTLSSESLQLKERLEQVLDTLTFVTRLCYNEFEKTKEYACEIAETEDLLIARLLNLAHFVHIWEFDEITFGWGLSNLEKDAERFKAVDQLLHSNLDNLRVYVIGSVSVFNMYIVGQNNDNDWLGVSTTAVRT